ncbi:hypothetical protein IMG5_098720 [Ichthyophthirius multifiliis]|uniref:Cyclin n=1 Tax=Ichthyophthirius multifiliis TaxID=5932 RepID=G0QS06_ICHMU|nr:hypothetical protein IMG5_098720 [Ichthyophthirius multifiliis]EGR32036.1 hypothetical protein IMG5_098720 [Ichthyophthirius multifiliis]|eukprot:XP_004035522.1 hypothetical protein IMG5_098720 [Ichthyophthirius multifiliis]
MKKIIMQIISQINNKQTNNNNNEEQAFIPIIAQNNKAPSHSYNNESENQHNNSSLSFDFEIEKQINLQKIVNYFEQTAQQQDLQQLTPHPTFSSQKLPSISTLDYLKRIQKFTDCSNVNFLLALIYVQRLKEEVGDQLLNSYTLLRLVLSACIIAMKYNNDQILNNEYYARIGGVKKPELAKLEKIFCELINFKLYVSEETFLDYVKKYGF